MATPLLEELPFTTWLDIWGYHQGGDVLETSALYGEQPDRMTWDRDAGYRATCTLDGEPVPWSWHLPYVADGKMGPRRRSHWWIG